MSVLFSRVKMCIAQQDLLKFQDLSTRYLHTVSWNEKVEGDYISSTDKKFFQSGEGPYWWSKYDFRNIPYIEIQKDIQVNKTLLLEDINKELLWKDNKFYGTTNCKSLQVRPNLPCIDINNIKGNELKKLMTNAGFSKIEVDAQSVFDVTGAGDTVTSVLAYAVAEGFSIDAAANLANRGAGKVVSQIGNSTVSFDEVINTTGE